MTLEELKIRPIARRNHISFVLFGAALIILSLIAQVFAIKLPAFIMLIAGLLALILGLLKWREPEFSFTFTPHHFIWHHHRGDIEIDWFNVYDLISIKVDKGLEQHELHYLGLKLKDFTPLTKTIPLRVAKSLYHEYRSLLHVAMVDARSRGLSAILFQEHQDEWRGSDKKKIDGLMGTFASRIHQLKQQLGADLYIPLTALDRHPDEFIEIFRQYKTAALNELEEHAQ